MGLLGFIQKSWKTLRQAIKALLDLNGTFEALITRIHQGPSLPCPNPTTSYWLEDPPFPELVNIQSEKLPESTDIVIIGSGITAAAAAHSLLDESSRKGQPITITVLEARDICSGATGRNGGHMKCSPHETFERLETKFGTERAVALTRFQLSHLQHLTEFCESKGYQKAECRKVETVDLFFDQKTFDQACHTLSRLRTLLPELEARILQAEQARQEFAVSGQVIGAITYQAGALWPYRFVTSLWNDLLHDYPKHITVETNTPASSIDKQGTTYKVHTNRGAVKCKHIVHATNAWMGHLLPQLNKKATGMRAHMSAQNPGDQHSYANFHGDRSWSIIHGPDDFDYMTQRPGPNGTGDIMLGGGAFRSKNHGLDQIGVWDDSRRDMFTSAYLAGILPIIFSQEKQQRQAGTHSRYLQQHWSGIISLTGDSLPFVGKLDSCVCAQNSGDAQGDAAEWIAAGYNGEGMVFAWLCGTALGLVIMGSEHEDIPASPGFPGGTLYEWFPKELLLDRERFNRIDVLDLADQL
ncbi:DAO-domain-containing protein [Aureobasidium namibiae CBS 147.97]|uniref:DAO-domain-containing protein n=1 Tax=Aureobasidium namibiae CBS 147.97 TaxID=1043004 RepID=A0A074WSV5_9PEZI